MMMGKGTGNSQRRKVGKGPLLVAAFSTAALAMVMGQPCAAQRSPDRHGAPSEQLPVSSAPSIQALAVAKDQTVYAGSFGRGIFRSDDRGRSWTAANEGLNDPFVLALTTSADGAVYAGTFRHGVFRSRDAGRSWQAINEGLKRLEIKALLIEGGVIYAGTGDGVYRLPEKEHRWTPVTSGLDETLVHSLVMSADHTLYAGTSGKGLFRHKSNEPAWARLSRGLVDHEGLVENFIRVLAVDREQALYVGTFDGGVFRSGDGGKTWQPISRALPNDSIRGILAREKELFVATGRGIFKSANHGRQWVPLNKGLTELSVQALTLSGDGSFYAGTSAGIFRSDNNGESWESASEGLEGPVKAPFK